MTQNPSSHSLSSATVWAAVIGLVGTVAAAVIGATISHGRAETEIDSLRNELQARSADVEELRSSLEKRNQELEEFRKELGSHQSDPTEVRRHESEGNTSGGVGVDLRKDTQDSGEPRVAASVPLATSDRTAARARLCALTDASIENDTFRLDIVSAEWMPEQRIRLTFSHQNKTSRALTVVVWVAANAGKTFFVDDKGDQYDAVATEKLDRDRRQIPAGATIRYAVLFKAPSAPPRTISVLYWGNPGSWMGVSEWSFPPVECSWE